MHIIEILPAVTDFVQHRRDDCLADCGHCKTHEQKMISYNRKIDNNS